MYPTNSRTGVILVNFKSYDLTVRCIVALIPFLVEGDAIICIDNNSEESSLETIRQELFGNISQAGYRLEKETSSIPAFLLNGFVCKAGIITVIVHKAISNKGFGAGCNIGTKIAESVGCKYLWFLNNDACPVAGKLDALKQICHSQKNSQTIVGTAIGGVQSGSGAKTFGFHLNPFSGVTRELFFKANQTKIHKLERNEFLSGCSMFMTLETFKSVGSFEEEYFLYYEETDWQMRARGIGYSLKASREVCVEHDFGGSIGSSSRNRERSLLSELCGIRSRMIFASRHCRSKRLLWKWFCLMIAIKRLLSLRFKEAFHIARVTLSNSGEALLYILSLHPSIYTTVFPNEDGRCE